MSTKKSEKILSGHDILAAKDPINQNLNMLIRTRIENRKNVE